MSTESAGASGEVDLMLPTADPSVPLHVVSVTDATPDPPVRKRGRKSEVRIREEDDGIEETNGDVDEAPVTDSVTDQPPAAVTAIPNTSSNSKKVRKQADEESGRRGIMANSDSALRRRDRIKSTARYSPPPVATRDRRKATAAGSTSFPSTYSRSSAAGRSSTSSSSTAGKELVTSCPVDVQQDSESGKMLVTLPDGTTYRLDATPVTAATTAASAGFSRKRRGRHDDEEEDEDTDDDSVIEAGADDPDDDDFVPTYNQMRRIKPSTASPAESSNKKSPAQRRTAAASASSMFKQIAKSPAASRPKGRSGSSSRSSNNFNNSKSKNMSEMRTTAIRAVLNSGKEQVTYVAAPKSISLTPVPQTSAGGLMRQPPRRSYGNQAKFIEDLPELSDCTGEKYGSESSEPATRMDRLPDSMLLIWSDLPLDCCSDIIINAPPAVSSSSSSTGRTYQRSFLPSSSASSSAVTISSTSSERNFAFRQILSPHTNAYPCLLCPSRHASASKSESELKAHYSMLHELAVDTATTSTSEDEVYICLEESSIKAHESGSEVKLNITCQYCEDEKSAPFTILSSLLQHYSQVHGLQSRLVDQEVILKMHTFLYCCKCRDRSFPDFKSLNQHMRSHHKLQTFPCRSCSFFTRDETRLKSHFKAKHMMNSTSSFGAGGGSGSSGSGVSAAGSSGHLVPCTECAYCHGLLMGSDRMARHIMTVHCIQTAVGQYSCVKCLQVAGSPDHLISHSTSCAALAKNPPSSNNDRSAGREPQPTCETGVQTSDVKCGCFLCEKELSSSAACQLHMEHVHTQWIDRPSPDVGLKTEDGVVSAGALVLTVSDIPSLSRLAEVGVVAEHGFYCAVCDLVIDVYPLFYMHMANVHNKVKVFRCKVSSCGQTFDKWTQLQEHVQASGHPQASVMQDTLGAICCHFCDEYFADRKEYELHHLTDRHAEKVPSLSDCKSLVTGGRQEARNWKCKTCHTWFGLTDSFVHHMEHETHRHACPYCGIDFALPSSRRTHIQSHHQEKTDVCEVCGVKQGSKERVVAHLVSHGIVFECNTCMKKFYQREQLNAHSESHGPAAECRWQSCGKKVLPSGLTAHVKQHRMEKDSKCCQCNKVCGSKAALESHREVHEKAEQSARAILSQSAANVAAKATASKSGTCIERKTATATTPALITTTTETVNQQEKQSSTTISVDLSDVIASLQQPELNDGMSQLVMETSVDNSLQNNSSGTGVIATLATADSQSPVHVVNGRTGDLHSDE